MNRINLIPILLILLIACQWKKLIFGLIIILFFYEPIVLWELFYNCHHYPKNEPIS